MAGIDFISVIEQLKPYLNKDGFLEVVIRNKKKRFVEFQKIALANTPEGEGQQLLQKVLNAVNKNCNIGDNAVKLIQNVTKLQQLSLILNGLNLCATCVGFAIMYEKLDKISEQINQIKDFMKEQNSVQLDYEFKKVLSEHSHMLDCRKTQKYFDEEKMRKLVADEYNVLNLLIDYLMKDLSVDQDSLIVSIYSMAAMLTVSIRYFDELYYFNNKETIGDGDVWFIDHDKWMKTFDRLTNPELVKRLQDHALFDLELSTKETDAYYMSLVGQIKDYVEEINDNMTLIETLNDKELVAEMRKALTEDIKKDIEDSVNSVDDVKDNPEIKKVYEEALRQVVVAA